jgi:hypothetical protein
MAHELQHMIHWEQKTHQRGVLDDTWLDEAMSTISRTFCGYGPDYDLVLTYEHAPSHSLTSWDGTADNYGVVYMWAQYFKDRIGSSIFASMLRNSQTGIGSVSAALTSAGYPRDFAGTFRDWGVANYSGNAVAWPGHPEWSYVSVNTWPGTYGDVTLPGLFPLSRQNTSLLPVLGPWSVNYFTYTPGSPPAGTVQWTPAAPAERGSFVDSGSSSLVFDMTAGTSYGFTTRGYLITQNPSGTASGGNATVARHELAANDAAPSAGVSPVAAQPVFREAIASGVVAEQSVSAGVQPGVSRLELLREREAALRASGARPPF